MGSSLRADEQKMIMLLFYIFMTMKHKNYVDILDSVLYYNTEVSNIGETK